MENRRRVSDVIPIEPHSIPSDRWITSSRAWRDVVDVMSRDVMVVSPAASVVAAARTMSEKNVSCLAVRDHGKVVGILTETDCVERVAGNSADLDQTCVAEIMSSPVETISPQCSVFHASKVMAESRVKRLPIVDQGRLVGIVTQTDLVRALTAYGMWREVADVMSTPVAGIDRKARVAEAAEVMGSRNISCVLAMDGNHPLGILTKKDVLKRVVASRLDPGQAVMEEVMSAPLISVPPHCSVFSASRLMAEKRVRRLVVIEGDRLCGIVAQTDIFRAVGRTLQEEEIEHLALLEKSDKGIFTISSDGKTTYVNPALLRLLGVSDASTLVGQPFLPERFWVDPEERMPLLEELGRGETNVRELALKTTRGKRVYVTLFFTLIQDGQGEINGSQGMLYDVTEKKELATLRKTEQALRESERRYRLFAEHAKDVMWTSDLNLRWTYFSPSIELLRGFTPAEAIGQTIDEIMTSASAAAAIEVLQTQLALAKKHGDASTRTAMLEVELLHKDGSTVWTEVKVSFLCGEDGEPVGLVGVARDVSERKRAEEELKRHAEALESANKALHDSYVTAQSATKAKSQFLANVSHEIRTPMTAILGFADVLAERLEKPEDVEAIETIKRNGEYLLNVINDVLDLSKIESGKLEIERLACSPLAVVEDVVSLMKVRAEAKGLSLEVVHAGPIPRVINTDPFRLKQILINLVGNAIKFTETGSVRIVTELAGTDGKEPKLRLQVIDTGVGMTEQQSKRVFTPFLQGDSSTTRRFGGTGLGLTIAKRTARLLGGDVTIHSVLGKGSTVTATVATGPLDGVGLLDLSGEPPLPEEPPISSCRRPQPRLDCRILLAEDGPDNQRLVSLILSKAGAEVTVVENGQQALQKALQHGPQPAGANQTAHPFDLILMDMQMPVMDGYEASRRLREAGYRDPIIALTAHAMKGDREKCLAAGCDDYLAKPIDQQSLLETVARYAPASATA